MKEVSIVLVRHTLQQGNVVSFQHDPPWETETEEDRGGGGSEEQDDGWEEIQCQFTKQVAHQVDYR